LQGVSALLCSFDAPTQFVPEWPIFFPRFHSGPTFWWGAPLPSFRQPLVHFSTHQHFNLPSWRWIAYPVLFFLVFPFFPCTVVMLLSLFGSGVWR